MGVDFAFPNVLSSMGAEADRYVGFKLFRALGSKGCFGVVPFPFDRKEDGAGRASEAVATIPLVLRSVYPGDDCCTPLYCTGAR